MVQPGLNAPAQGTDKYQLRRLGLIAVATADTTKSARQTQFKPIGGAIHGTVETTGIDKRFQEQQGVAETLLPIRGHATFQLAEHARADIRVATFRKNQKTTVVGDELEAVELDAEIPADPTITSGAFERGGRQADLGQPAILPGRNIPQCLANFRQFAKVMILRHLGLIARLFMSLEGADDDLGQNWLCRLERRPVILQERSPSPPPAGGAAGEGASGDIFFRTNPFPLQYIEI